MQGLLLLQLGTLGFLGLQWWQHRNDEHITYQDINDRVDPAVAELRSSIDKMANPPLSIDDVIAPDQQKREMTDLRRRVDHAEAAAADAKAEAARAYAKALEPCMIHGIC